MNLVMSADDRYALPLGVLLISIFANKNPGYDIKVYVIDSGLSSNSKEKLQSIEKEYSFKINYLEASGQIGQEFPRIGRLNEADYYKLLAPVMINENRLLYLDSDMVVLGDLKSLYESELKDGAIIGATTDSQETLIKNNFFRPISRYFNAGLLLFDCQKYREKNIWPQALELIKKNEIKIKYGDQDIFNHLLENDWQSLPKEYDIQQDEYDPPYQGEIRVLHYTGAIKPWHYSYSNPNIKYFSEYLQLSPWADWQPQKTLKKIILKNLKKTLRLISSPNAFIKIAETSAKIRGLKE